MRTGPNFIVAESLYQADLTATVDWGWRRTASDKWLNKEGDTIQYLDTDRKLQGYRNGIIFTGYGWYRNKNLRRLEDIALALNYQLKNYRP